MHSETSRAAMTGIFIFIFLLSAPVIQGQNDWTVTCAPTQICAVVGSTVDMSCSYRYPDWRTDDDTTVGERLWFTNSSGDEPVDLRADSEYSGRVQYLCGDNDCTLRITDLRESDSAVYKFSFTTNKPGEKYTGEAGVTLSVTGLQVQVTPSTYDQKWAELKCLSSCHQLDHSSFTWYKNGRKTGTETASFSVYFNDANSYSCALKGHEDFPPPPVCVSGESCNRVIYTDRRICAFKGSSVEISCSYNSLYYVESKFWFSPERSRRWQNPSEPEDLSKDSEYSGRVQVETERGRSTLRITDLRDTDSAHYHFTFKTKWSEWRSSLPGTTLTVTTLQVQLTRTITVHQSYTEAELKCLSSCSPAGRLSYVWIRNGEKIMEEGSSYTDRFSPGDMISCALKGHENHGSPPVYAPKLPSVSVSPSAEIVEGSSVTLTCSSDANPAANYTWYKEDEDSPKASGQIFTITDLRPEHSGNYSCEAQNTIGRQKSTLNLTVVVSGESVMIMFIPIMTIKVLVLIPLVIFCLWTRKKKTLNSNPEPNKAVEMMEVNSVYENIPTAARTKGRKE